MLLDKDLQALTFRSLGLAGSGFRASEFKGLV